MPVRLVAGRAGSGKTHWCQSEICEALNDSLVDGPQLIMLVPEQATLQMERSLLAMLKQNPGATALGRCEVLSFRRLSHRVLNESMGSTPVPLTSIGRQMALRYLVGKHRRSLREFGKVAERNGFIAEIARGVAELLQEAITVEQLEMCAREAAESNEPIAARLHDTALLYRAYLDYLGDQRVDPEGVLDLARSRLGSTPWLTGARFWIDGFAGLTQQQTRMIAALAQISSHIDIALLLDPQRGKARDVDGPPDELSLFARTEQTWASLLNTLVGAGISVEEPLLLGKGDCPRFEASRTLADLERRLFAVPPMIDDHSGLNTPQQRTEGASDGQLLLFQSHPSETSEPDIRLVKAPNRRVEVETTVQTILDLVQRPDRPMRYREIAVVVRDLSPYHDLFSANLQKRGIPFFIDRRRPTYHHPVVQASRAVLALIGGAPFDKSIAMLLKSGLTGLTDETCDAMENNCLVYGRSTPESWDDPWLSSSSAEQGRQRLRQRMGEWWPTEKKDDRHVCKTWVARFYALLERLRITEQLAAWCDDAESRGDHDEAGEHEQVWNDLVKLLDELVAAMGDLRMTGRQLRDVLESGLSEFTLGLIPSTLDQLLVSSIERSRHPPVKAMFVLGFADGHFPARVSNETIFGDQERAFLESRAANLGRTRTQQLLDERLLAYIAVTRPSEFLWISYPENDGAGPIAPSPYWSSLRAAVPDIPTERVETNSPETVSAVSDLAAGTASNLRSWAQERLSDKDAAAWLALYDWTTTSTSKIRATVGHALSALGAVPEAVLTSAASATLWRTPYRTSVTRLETFAKCPFKHYAAYGLKLTERPKHEVSPLHLGRLYHTVLEQFVNDLIETETTLREMTPSDIAERLSNVCEHVVPQYAETHNLIDAERNTIDWRSRHELPISIEGQRSTIGQTPLQPTMTEKQFGDDDAMPALELTTSNGRKILVRGKIDRVDLRPVGDASLAVVFDYKRSLGKRLKLDEVYHGLALQLLAYLLVIRDGSKQTEIIPGGAFYLPLVGPYRQLKHPGEADAEDFTPFEDFKPRGIIDFDWIHELDPNLESKQSAAFSAYKKSDGSLGRIDSTDAVGPEDLPRLLGHVRRKMTELAEAWISGDIQVKPARLGNTIACTYCPYRSVCRFEYATGRTRDFATMSRSNVLSAIEVEAGADND
ncbi:MAG: PD-(D/E)XK nuclease family protein [Phycisphaerales bacterium]|nr:PD-(D/E)XK nuclease family protein [Phycisphaerales bacterium]